MGRLCTYSRGIIMAAPTWANLLAEINYELERETFGTADATMQARWLRIANEFLKAQFGDIARTVTLSGSSITSLLSGGYITFTSSMREIVAVYYDDIPLANSSRYEMDAQYPGWQSTSISSASPLSYFVEDGVLQFAPPLTDVSLITVIAKYSIPDLKASYGGSDLDPNGWIPEGFEYLPAYHVLTQIPWDPNHDAQAQRYNRNQSRVNELLPRAIAAAQGMDEHEWRGE